ncbi:MAG: hypothetical protein JWM93_1013 [Frankiales bacterium]|nr:hypothetical protein [Frankiales bacterium]
MPNVGLPTPPLPGSRGLDRRTLLVGAAGALATAGLRRPARAAGYATSVAARSGPRFDPVLGRRLQRVLHDALRDPGTHFPGAILHVAGPTLGTWTGVVGLGRVAPAAPMRRDDRFRAGSIAKPFVAVVVLQLAERGRLSLDAPLPEVLPASVVGRFANAAGISVRMLLGHRSGIPEWDTPAVDDEIAHHPAKVWNTGEILDRAAAQPPVFAPGTSYSYSNTDYNLLGLIIEQVTGHSWRHEVSGRVISPLGLTRTALPAPGHRSLAGGHAHGYGEVDGRRVDLTGVDPSMAGAAGGGALVTTVQDLARFLDALLKRRLFRHRETLRQMLAFAPAADVGGQVGYGLGIERRLLPGGIEAIGHLGGTAGYRAYVGRLRPQGVTITLALNWQDDPTPVLIPAVKALAAARQ